MNQGDLASDDWAGGACGEHLERRCKPTTLSCRNPMTLLSRTSEWAGGGPKEQPGARRSRTPATTKAISSLHTYIIAAILPHGQPLGGEKVRKEVRTWPLYLAC